MSASTECAAALLYFRYPSILVNESREKLFFPVWPFMSKNKKSKERSVFQNRLLCHHKKFLTGFNQTKPFYDQVRTFLQFRRSLFFTCSFFLWSFVYENKKQRKINFSEPLDRPCTIKEPLGDSWYQVLRNKKVFGRGGCLHSAPVISAFFFFVLLLEFLLREQNKKQREINFSESLDMPRYIIYKVSPGVLQNIKVLHQGAYLPPAQVISALSFFVFFLEFLLQRTKRTKKDQFLTTALYVTIIKSQYLGFTKQKIL